MGRGNTDASRMEGERGAELQMRAGGRGTLLESFVVCFLDASRPPLRVCCAFAVRELRVCCVCGRPVVMILPNSSSSPRLQKGACTVPRRRWPRPFSSRGFMHVCSTRSPPLCVEHAHPTLCKLATSQTCGVVGDIWGG